MTFALSRLFLGSGTSHKHSGGAVVRGQRTLSCQRQRANRMAAPCGRSIRKTLASRTIPPPQLVEEPSSRRPCRFPGFSALWWSFEAKSSLRGAKKYSNIWLLNSGLSLNIECLVSQETPSQAGRESDDGLVLLKCSPMSSRLSQQTDPSTTNHNTSAATGSGSGSGAAPGLLDGPGPGPGPAVPMSCCPPV